MKNVVRLDKARKNKAVKEPAEPNKHYKLSEQSKYIYRYNLQECIRLYLIQPGEYPPVEELEAMPVYQASRIMKKLNSLFEEKGEKRLVGLTRRTYKQETTIKMNDEIFGNHNKNKRH